MPSKRAPIAYQPQSDAAIFRPRAVVEQELAQIDAPEAEGAIDQGNEETNERSNERTVERTLPRRTGV